MDGVATSLTGWGRTAPSRADVIVRPARDAAGLARALSDRPARGVIARGLGRSYGDSAQSGGGVVVRLHDGPDDIVVDDAAATATVPAGISLDDLLRVLVPRGFFVPVSPGTRFVTVGGAVASDIHGKNHHVEGSFGNHVLRMSLLLADGSVVELGPARHPELFWATVGGMGLTGVIVDVTMRVLPIETSRCSVDTDRAADLDALLALMDEGDRYYRYSVAWIDLMAKGARLGRSVLTRGDHATVDQLTPRDAVDPLRYDPHQLAMVPPVVPRAGVLNRMTVAAFNEGWFRKAPRRRVAQIVSIPAYFHPLDFIGSWNRLYGRQGFLQYQFVVPFGQEPALRTVVERLAASGTASFLAVLKRFGAANPGPLSFPGPAGRWRSTSRPRPAAWPRCSTASTRSCSTPAGATTWPRMPTPRPLPSAGDTPASTSGGPSAPASTRPACGPATRAGACTCWATEPAPAAPFTDVRTGACSMENALGEPQVIVLLGGTSDIGRAIVAALVSPSTRTVVLAGRRPDDISAAGLERPGLTVDRVHFDATDTASHDALIRDLAARHGDLDVVIVAFGQLAEQAEMDDDPAAAAALVTVNYTGAVSVGLAAAGQFRRQGHGRLVVLSSVAGERVRKANFVYGSSKAGLDGFAQGLGDALAGSGASVLVVRPGFVHTRMTRGMKAAPLATTPEAVATATVRGLRAGRRTVWVPSTLRPLFSVLRHLPGPLWRRLPLA